MEFLIREMPDRPDRAVLRIPVEVRLVPAIEAIPDQLFFGTVALGSSSEKNVLVRFSPDRVPRRADEVVLRHDLGTLLDVRWTRMSGQFWDLTGRLTPTPGMESIQGTITIQLRAANGSSVDLPVRARIARH